MLNARVKEMKPKDFYKSTAWRYLSRYVLLKFSDGLISRCCTCGNPIQINHSSAHCGHFIKVTDSWAVALEIENTGPQCARCNTHQSGKPYEFSEWIKKTYGNHELDRLNIKKHNFCKLDKLTLGIMGHHFKKLFQSEVEKKGNPWKKAA